MACSSGPLVLGLLNLSNHSISQDHLVEGLVLINSCVSPLWKMFLHLVTVQAGQPVLPALAQVTEREGKYLAELFIKLEKHNGGKAHSAKDISLGDPFVYKHLGSTASVGHYKALVDLRQNKDANGISMAGFVSWLVWRSAYLTRVLSWRNRFYVAVNWATTFVFGRDNSRIGSGHKL